MKYFRVSDLAFVLTVASLYIPTSYAAQNSSDDGSASSAGLPPDGGTQNNITPTRSTIKTTTIPYYINTTPTIKSTNPTPTPTTRPTQKTTTRKTPKPTVKTTPPIITNKPTSSLKPVTHTKHPYTTTTSKYIGTFCMVLGHGLLVIYLYI